MKNLTIVLTATLLALLVLGLPSAAYANEKIELKVDAASDGDSQKIQADAKGTTFATLEGKLKLECGDDDITVEEDIDSTASGKVLCTITLIGDGAIVVTIDLCPGVMPEDRVKADHSHDECELVKSDGYAKIELQME